MILSWFTQSDVGNKAATFPLQLLGFDVDPIHSVQFSNRTGYENGFTGDRLNGDQLINLLQGLEQNSLLQGVGHILTGYIGSVSFLQAILHVIDTVRRHASSNNTVRYVCEPVLGDKGVFYVPHELVGLYRDTVIALADVVTPNQFEAEQLTGVNRIASVEDAQQACRALHTMRPGLVLIISLELPGGEEVMTMIASQRRKNDDTLEQWKVDSPRHYTGTGDLCAALLLAHTSSSSSSTTTELPAALERVVNSIGVLQETDRQRQATGLSTVQSRELRLIPCKRIIEDPPQRFRAERLE